MSQKKINFNYVKWGFIVALVGTIGTVLTVPEIRCSIGLLADTCAIVQKEVDFITQSETGKALAGVTVQVIAIGAPEIQYTDSNGYVKAKIASRGDVRINLSKSGYPVQDFNINLANDQNTVRIIRFATSGQPDVSSVPTIPPVPPTPLPKEISWDETASNLIGNIDQDFTYICIPNGTIGNVWGTDFYTSGSSICSAAVHAGMINARDGGKVQIRIRPGEKFYNGTACNGMISNRQNSYQGSFIFLNSAGLPIVNEQIQLIEWNETASDLNGKLDQDFTYMCSPNGTVSNNVYGTDLYTNDSSICSAAVHAGIINAKNGGAVQIRIRPGEKFYNGTARNGMVSNHHDSYPWSFKFIK
jgi:hypothetical protein